MKHLNRAALAGALLLSAHSTSAQHLEAGAAGQNQGDRLVWDTHELGDVSTFAKQLTLSTSGRYAGYYNDNLTLTSLHNTDAGGPAPGSFIQAEIVSVAGPDGAFFGFWEGIDLGGGVTPTFNIATGSDNLSLRYALSDASLGAGLPGQDPFGHIHGRRFTATEEGLYTVGFRAVDTSVNGTGGGSIHAPSDIIYIQFAAVPEPSMFAIGGAGLLGLWLIRRKRKSPRVASALILLSMLLAPAVRAQLIPHFHLAAGAVGTAPGAQLQLNSADNFLAESGYAAVMTLRTNLPTVGYYMGGPTFTAAEGDGTEGPPAASGAQLWLVVRAVDGPAGGHWSFWEAGPDEDYGTSITFSYATGTTNGTNAFILSQTEFAPNPYGHIHGRAFTADKPGLYTVWVQIIDRSRSGPGGGPLHAPSPIYRFYYQAGTTIARLAKSPSQVTATFATLNSNAARQYSYYLEATSALDASALWTTVAGPIRGDNRLRTLAAPVEPDAPETFYRLRVTSP